MKFTCNSCGAQYMISDEKVGPSGVKVRCKKCGNVILVRRATEEQAAPAPSAPAGDTIAGQGAAGTNGAAPPSSAGAQGGLDAELGQAFDNAFGEPPPAAEPERDLGATQAMGAEDQARVAAAAPPPTEWYVAIGQAQVGPLPLAEVKRKWEAGDVGPDSLVWRPGMADWQPLTSVAELAGYLAPVARATPAPAREAAPASRAASVAVAGTAAAEHAAPAEDVTWKPVGASALAALASEELAARSEPAERRPTASAGAPSGVKSLVEALPDGGGVDPTGAIPLSIKGLEITGEKKLERRSTVATRAEEMRHRRSLTRWIGFAAVGVLAVVGGATAWVLTQGKPAPAPVAVAPPPPPAAAPPPTAPAPAPQPPPAAAATPPAPVAAATPLPATAPAAPSAAAPPAPAPAPAAAKAEPAPPPKPAHVGKGKHAKVAKAEPPPRAAPAPRPAASAPARKKDSLLDFESSDSALDEALGGGGGGSKRSVYVPPAAGGGLPDKLSPAQINEAVAGRIESLRRCVSEQKGRDPSASGVLKLRWMITGDGSVRDVKSLPGEYASGPFSSCISGVVKGIRFPRSTTTGQEVTFPFSF